MKQDLERIKKLMKGEGYRNEGYNYTNVNVKYKAILIHKDVTLDTAELCLSLCFAVHL